MADSLWSGRRFRTFNMMVDCYREGSKIEVDISLPAPRVVRVTDELVATRGKASTCASTTPELISLALAW